MLHHRLNHPLLARWSCPLVPITFLPVPLVRRWPSSLATLRGSASYDTTLSSPVHPVSTLPLVEPPSLVLSLLCASHFGHSQPHSSRVAYPPATTTSTRTSLWWLHLAFRCRRTWHRYATCVGGGDAGFRREGIRAACEEEEVDERGGIVH